MNEEDFDLEDLKKLVVSELEKTYTVEEALKAKEEEEQLIQDSFNSLWNNYHSVESLRKEAYKTFRIVKYKTVLSNLLPLLIRYDIRDEVSEIFKIINSATSEMNDEKKLLYRINIALQKLQAHNATSCNYELALLLANIFERDTAIYNQVSIEMDAASARMKGINTQSPETYIREKEELTEKIDGLVLKLGLNK